MARQETNFIFGEYRGLLRYRSISEWSKDLGVSMTAIRTHLDKGGGMNEFIDRHHNEEAWGLFERFCYA